MKTKFTQALGSILFFLLLGVFPVVGQNESENPPKEKTPLELLNEGNERYKRGDILGSIKKYSAVIEKQPFSPVAFQRRGRSKRRMQNYQGAIKDYDKAIQLKPNFVNAYLGKAQTYVALQNYNAAVTAYSRALEMNPDKKYLGKIYYNRGLAHLEQKDYQDALADLTKTIELNPKMDKAYLNRGNIYYHFNQSKKACADWIQAKELGNEKAKVNLERGCK